ncbi:DUF72 domain-containing protein [Massilia pseudoviolaceinigra]|uniref:DUF72 domain-containing protein n=1 Tax=Massilia pseudoviolaceinigra TaxID=3057165 RepID=UPI002796D91C|nr:DUF72 domain-containing protein [Massilia sp. CCM 9206]MDQ1921172.1 DUF72 domain-containing protein [Massilia sp. CCM 9206]
MTNRTHQDAGALRIGCAGWTISREAAGAFETAGSHLERYARVLGTVEINSSFYRPHQAKTYERWAGSVPPDFRFAVKLPRTITHDARLVGIDAPLSQFAAEAGALGDKLGCLLVQLPPKLAFDAAVASDFFARLKDTFGCMIACEARHRTWFGEDASELLRRETVTRVIADPAKGQDGPHVPTTESIYVRLHGAPRIYYSPYSADYLAQLARDMATHAAHGRDVWCIFDNTASGAALPNALELREALGLARPGQASPRTAPDPGLPA